jgi:hypothetical protein
VTLDNVAKAVASIAGGSGTSFAFTDSDGFQVAGIAAGTTVGLTSVAGSITQGAGAGAAISGTALTANATAAGQSVTLDNVANTVSSTAGAADTSFVFTDADNFQVAGIMAGMTIELMSIAGSIELTGAVTSTDVAMMASGAAADIVQGPAGAVTAARLAVQAGRDVRLINDGTGGTTANAIAVLADLTLGGLPVTNAAGRDYRVTTGTALTVAGPVVAGAAQTLALRAGGALTVAAAPGSVGVGAGGASNVLLSGAGLVLNGAVRGADVALVAVGAAADINQGPAGAVTATRLAAQAGRDVRLLNDGTGGTTANAIAALASVSVDGPPVSNTAGQDYALTTAGDLAVQGPVTATAGAATLRATGDITSTATVSAATTVTLQAAGMIDNAGTIVATGTTATPGATTLTATGGILNSGVIRGGSPTTLGTVLLTATGAGADIGNTGTIEAFGTAPGSGTVTLLATDAITNGNAATITAGANLDITAGGRVTNGVILGGVPSNAALNAGGDLTVIAGGGISTAGQVLSSGVAPGSSGTILLRATGGNVEQSGGSIIATAANGTIILEADTGSVTQSGGGTFATQRFRVEGGQSVLLGNDNNVFQQLLGADLGTDGGTIRGGSFIVAGDIVSGGTATLLANGSLIVGGAGLAPLLRATTGGLALVAQTGTVTIGASTMQALGGGLSVTAAGGIGVSGLAATVAGDLAFAATAGATNLAGTTASVGGNATLTGQGGVTLAGSTLGVGGSLTLGATGGAIALTEAQASAGGAIAAQAAGPLTLTRATLAAGGSLGLQTGAALGLGDSRVTAGASLTATASGGIDAPRATLAAGTDMSLTAGGGIALANGTATAGGALSLTGAGGIALTNATAAAGGAMTLRAQGAVGFTNATATAGGALLAATTGELSVTGGSLTSTGSSLTLTADSGATIQATSLTAATLLTIRDAPGVEIGGGTLLSADQGYIEGPVIATGGVTATIGTNLLLQAPGGITNGTVFTVLPRTPGQAPAIIYDVRRNPAQDFASILAAVQPDRPGLAPDAQPTQVRAGAGTEAPNPFFGAASSNAAGNIVLNILAPNSPVFLLMDGGIVTGTIQAGRLAVHGTGGRADLTGQLGGLVGSQAARASEITRPAEPSSIQNYRINNCVIASINCVTIARYQPTPPTVRTSVAFIFRPGQINPVDVTIPNTGENDYE